MCFLPDSFFLFPPIRVHLAAATVFSFLQIHNNEGRTANKFGAHFPTVRQTPRSSLHLFVSRHTLISPNFFSSPNMDWVSGEGLQIDIGNCILFLSAASVSYLCMYLHLFNDFVMFSTHSVFNFCCFRQASFFIDLKNSTHLWLKTVQTSKPFIVVWIITRKKLRNLYKFAFSPCHHRQTNTDVIVQLKLEWT